MGRATRAKTAGAGQAEALSGAQPAELSEGESGVPAEVQGACWLAITSICVR